MIYLITILFLPLIVNASVSIFKRLTMRRVRIKMKDIITYEALNAPIILKDALIDTLKQIEKHKK